MENYNNMPMRAYEIEFTENRIHPDLAELQVFKQVYQGRSVSEAVKAAEIDQLDNPCYPEPNRSDTVEEAWNAHLRPTACKPKYIVNRVCDLGIIANANVGVPA